MRRLTALIASLALGQLSLGGVIAGCTQSAALDGHEQLEVAAASLSHDHHATPPTPGNQDGCAGAEHQGCVAMSSCAVALPGVAASASAATLAHGPAVISLADGFVASAGPPDTPPPRT